MGHPRCQEDYSRCQLIQWGYKDGRRVNGELDVRQLTWHYVPCMSEASKQALKRGVSPTHELMMDWIIQNPGGTLREMGAYFDYSVSWLSTVMNSDAFKAYAAERLKDVHTVVTQDVPTRMRGLAHLAIDKMEEMLEKTADPDLIKDSFDKVMNRYGYAPGSARGAPSPLGSVQQNNLFFLSPQQFVKAQETLIRAHSNPPALPHSELPEASPQPAAVPDDSEEIQSGS